MTKDEFEKEMAEIWKPEYASNTELDNYGRKVIRSGWYYGLGYCVNCEGDRLIMCRECGSFHVHNNSACGDPGCCGPNEDYCVDCQSTDLEYYDT